MRESQALRSLRLGLVNGLAILLLCFSLRNMSCYQSVFDGEVTFVLWPGQNACHISGAFQVRISKHPHAILCPKVPFDKRNARGTGFAVTSTEFWLRESKLSETYIIGRNLEASTVGYTLMYHVQLDAVVCVCACECMPMLDAQCIYICVSYWMRLVAS